MLKFVKNWTLPISMICGILAYFLGREVPLSAETRMGVLHFVEVLQPLLLFVMLFIAFCKVKPTDMRPHRWHLWLLLTQCGLFVLCTVLPFHYATEAFMLAIICPTATACAVVTQKLGGDSASTTTYTILISLAVAIIVPIFLPVHSFLTILQKVFPLLIFPLFLAWGVRYFLPKVHAKILSVKDLAFYLWAVALALAIAITCRALVHSHESITIILTVAVATLAACIFQFSFGWWVGKHYGMRLEAGQAMGQKNTIFIIWLGYTFLSPVSATAGGFYSIWHNVINSWQLYQKRKKG